LLIYEKNRYQKSHAAVSSVRDVITPAKEKSAACVRFNLQINLANIRIKLHYFQMNFK
jgi:hypothetical protein